MKNNVPGYTAQLDFLRTMLITLFAVLCTQTVSVAQELQMNQAGYFETPGLNILVFNNEYNGLFFDEKTAGIEIIHHGVRTATGGAVRLQNTPEQWDLIPTLMDKKIDTKTNSIEVTLKYEAFDFTSRLVVKPKGKGVELKVYLDDPLPETLKGRAGFNLEFLPSSYFEKAYLIDGNPGEFPLYPSGLTKIEPASKRIDQFGGHHTFDDRGRDEFITTEPLATGNTIVLAPEDPERTVKISCDETEIMLFDGRNLAQNGWYIVRSVFPKDKTGNVLTWYLEPNIQPNWIRSPNIGFSQVGYQPVQEKIAVIELDQNDTPLKTASLVQVTAEGKNVEKFKGEVTVWGKFKRYNYARFDFSQVREPGLYFIRYGDHKTNTFSIKPDVYADIWHPTMDVWFPVAMDHMQVNEAYRVWHGVPFLDDALQAPTNWKHFDGYEMGESTDTRFKPYERIPGLDVGGWFDAGDFDIQTGSHCHAILSLSSAWEKFNIDRDETLVDQKNRFVDMHRPDGSADILQQIEHGTLNVVAQVENIGHPVRGIVVPNLHQYHHLGDASTETDNLPYNPDLKPYETDGKSSGTKDDRWAFTTRNRFLDYYTAAALSSASRAMKGYNDELAQKSLSYAKKLWDDENIVTKKDTSRFALRYKNMMLLGAAIQLYTTTHEEKYAQRFKDSIWKSLETPGMFGMAMALEAYPQMDKAYQQKLREYVIKYKDMCDAFQKENPYGVPISGRNWGGNGRVVSWATTNYFAHKYFPDIMGPEYVYKGLNYIFGCHPYSNISFVSAVGTRSKKITYGNNRADFSFIAGGIVPGLLLLEPDFPENKEDWPFLWGENEVTVGGCADYVLLSAAAAEMSSNE